MEIAIYWQQILDLGPPLKYKVRMKDFRSVT